VGETVKFNSSTRKPLILVSPLDWGLGHTTRCIPLIAELISLGCDVVIACNSTQKAILQQEFPQVDFAELEGYNMRYGKNRLATFGRLLFQAPKILTKIKQENQWLRAFLTQNRVDAVISDNRFGLYAPAIPTVFITHQLQVKTGLGAMADKIVLRWNYRKIRPFTVCWVPDSADSPSLAGELSHPASMPGIPVQYIGGLSRLSACATPGEDVLLIILSGPEPLRTVFETLLLKQLAAYKGKVVLVRGLPAQQHLPSVPAHCTVYNHVDAATLHQLICSAKLVISRCGYTTVMDLLKLQKKSILVPTPGQAEQEYLADHLREQGLAYTVKQKDFSLSKALQEAAQFPYQTNATNMESYKPVVAAFADMLKKKKGL
jgi:UDP:flavonoid glycosyltransferase YjiC (YdhE family)